MFGDGFVGSPQLGFGLDDASREVSLGWRLAEARSSGLVFGLDVVAARRENLLDEGGGERRYGVGFRTLAGADGGAVVRADGGWARVSPIPRFGPDQGRGMVNRGRAVMRRDRKRAAKETGDAIRAWLFLRHVEAYLEAWRAHATVSALEPVFEPGPFPIRLQTAVDVEAARFESAGVAGPPRGGRSCVSLLGSVGDGGSRA